MKNLLRYLWLFSLLSFVIAYMFSYSGMPEEVSVGFQSTGVAFIRLSLEAYFYLGLAIVVFTNMALYSLVKLFEWMPVNTLNAFSFFYGKEEFKTNLISWLYSLMAILNMAFIAISAFVAAFNSNQVTNLFNYGFILYLWPALILIWLAMLVGMLVRQK